MIISSSLIKVRILTAVMLLVSVSFFVHQKPVFAQANNLLNGKTAGKQFKLSHPLNYHPESRTESVYSSMMFRSAVPETLNVYAIRVQFKPDNNSQTTGDGRFDVSSNYPDSVDAPPHDSLYFIHKLEFLKNYYYKSSKGRLIINYVLLPSVRNLPNEMEVYSPRRTENLGRMGNLFYDVWRSADSTIDFSGINPNNSAFIIFHAGVGRDVDLASQGLFVGELDLPSIYMGLSTLRSIYGDTTQGYYTNEGTIISNSCILPEQEYRIVNTSFGDVYLELGMNGIVVATIGSHLGLPDLFDTETGRTAIGRFGLMDGQAIFSYLGVFPPEPSAWEKQYLGWVEPIVVGTGGTYTTKAATLDVNGNESVYKILISGKEYFLVENRNRDAYGNGQTIYFVNQNGVRDSMRFTKDEDGFNSSDIWKLKGSITDVDELDWSVPGLKNDTANYQGGILVWHIDENVIEAKIGSNTINTDIDHRGVDVEEAKGSQDIGVVVPTPIGDIISDGFFVDFWYNGEHYRPSDIYRNEFNQTTFPNSKSYSNINSRVCLSAFSQIGPTMTFTYQVCGNVANITGFPRYVGIDTTGNAQPIGFDYNDNSFDEIFVNINDTLFGFRDNGNSIRVDMPNGFLKDSASGFAVGFLNYNIGSNNKFVTGVSGSRLNLISFVIDTATGAPLVQSFDAGERLTSPNLIKGTLSQPNSENRIYIGTQNGRIALFSLDSLTFLFDFVATSKVISLAYSSVFGSYPDGFSFISDSNKYFASSNITFGTNIDPNPVKVTSTNRIIRNAATGGDTVISNNLGITTVNSTPTICDINGDGQQEIILTADNKIYAINKFGVVLDNFPFSIPNVSLITSGVAVADLNGDNIAEVIFGTGDGRVYAYSINGKVLDGFPINTGGRIRSTPAVVNTGGNFGIMVYSEDGYLYGYKTPWAYSDTRVLWKNFLRNSAHTNDGAGSILSVTGTQPCLPSDKVYNWPNPAYGKSTNIRYFLNGDVTGVSIKIMDLSGELVTTLAGTTNKGLDNEVQWDISTVQSGIYIAVLELNGGCSETASIKIAVVK
ncbi:MAG TPA: T9SS type A sorting domain-containing protein [Ignavibacteria bacterium]|nr:T9SS type A sorting domain-containing protein [Ignavibacteria bacterium]HMQ99223.1 T9SS type A sorting domain-containing protein [Ignavibacteria bacterium]